MIPHIKKKRSLPGDSLVVVVVLFIVFSGKELPIIIGDVAANWQGKIHQIANYRVLPLNLGP